MIKNLSIIVLILSLISCDSIDLPSNLNYLDPDSPNYIGIQPTNLKVRSLTEQSVTVTWDYISNNYELFKVEVTSSFDNEKEVLYSESKFITLTNLDTSQTYTIKVQAMFEEITTKFSDSIVITHTNFSSFEVSKLKKIIKYGTVDYSTISPDHNYAAFVSNEINIVLPNLNFKYVTTISSSASKLLFSYNDDYLLIINTSLQLEIWRTDTWSLDHIISSMEVLNCESSLTNNTIAISNNEEVRILELTTGSILATFPNFKNTSALRFSDDGQYLIIGNSENQVKIIDTNNWSEIKSFTASGAILSVDISLDNRYLLYTVEKNLEVIDLFTDQSIRSYTSYLNNIIIQALFTTNPDIIILATGKEILQIYASTQLPERIVMNSVETITNFCKDKSNSSFIFSGFPATYFGLRYFQGGSWYQIVN